MVTAVSAHSTPTKILQAATQALLHGGAGTLRVDQVAADAGINKRMIYHHFGDRAGLIEAALASQLNLLLSPSSGLSPTCKEVLRLFVHQLEPAMADTAARSDLMDQPFADDTLMSAAKIVLAHFLVHGKSPDLAQVQPSQWQQFASEMLSYAFAHDVAIVSPDPPSPVKPRYRVTSSSRLRPSRT